MGSRGQRFQSKGHAGHLGKVSLVFKPLFVQLFSRDPLVLTLALLCTALTSDAHGAAVLKPLSARSGAPDDAVTVTGSVRTGAPDDAVTVTGSVRTGAPDDAVTVTGSVRTGAPDDAVTVTGSVKTGESPLHKRRKRKKTNLWACESAQTLRADPISVDSVWRDPSETPWELEHVNHTASCAEDYQSAPLQFTPAEK
ncbi:UNVERIFIED_CONTAM: hypothetical protein FKN15_020918 [Acipenser sinensis]